MLCTFFIVVVVLRLGWIRTLCAALRWVVISVLSVFASSLDMLAYLMQSWHGFVALAYVFSVSSVDFRLFLVVFVSAFSLSEKLTDIRFIICVWGALGTLSDIHFIL